MSKSLASVSLDLDNKWSYLKTHGDPGWEEFPSYLDLLVPRILNVFAERGLNITVFVVGQDAALPKNNAALAAISAAGHEIGNHSFHHEPWLHRYTRAEIETEVARAEEAIESVTGQRPVGFRGPGFSCSPEVLDVLVQRGYLYDASTFPTFLGPLARAYFFMTARMTVEEKRDRELLFGKMSEGFQSLRPYVRTTPSGRLLEIQVTTMPVFKIPIHLSYLLYLRQFSSVLAFSYLRVAVGLCRACGVEPSMLLHPLDFLGADDDPDLGFFPAMGFPSAKKIRFAGQVLDYLGANYRLVNMIDHATSVCPELTCVA